MQAFIDGEFGPAMGCMDNVVLAVDASQAQLGYMPYFVNNTAIATEPIKGSTIYMVQHHIKPGKGEALFANMGKIMSEPGAQEGMDEKLKAQGFKNHSFFPLQGKTEGLFACCIWEAKEGLGVADVEKMMENHWGVGGFCDKTTRSSPSTATKPWLASPRNSRRAPPPSRMRPRWAFRLQRPRA